MISVCQNWKKILDSDLFWKQKFCIDFNEDAKSFELTDKNTTWREYYKIQLFQSFTIQIRVGNELDGINKMTEKMINKMEENANLKSQVSNGISDFPIDLKKRAREEGYTSVLRFNYEIKEKEIADEIVGKECFETFAKCFLNNTKEKSKVETVCRINKEKNEIEAIFFMKSFPKVRKPNIRWEGNQFFSEPKPSKSVVNANFVTFLKRSKASNLKKIFNNKLLPFLHVYKLSKKLQKHKSKLSKEQKSQKKKARKTYTESLSMPWAGFFFFLNIGTLKFLNMSSNQNYLSNEDLNDFVRIHEFLGCLKSVAVNQIENYSSFNILFDFPFPWTGFLEIMVSDRLNKRLQTEFNYATMFEKFSSNISSAVETYDKNLQSISEEPFFKENSPEDDSQF